MTSLTRRGLDRDALWRQLDPLLIVVPLLVAVMGTLSVYSTTKGGGEEPVTQLAERQMLFVGVGVALMVGVSVVDYRRVADWAFHWYALAIVSLVAVLYLGTERKGSQAWFDLGVFQLQPSEFAKIALVFALAALLSPHLGAISAKTLASALVLVALPLGLVLMQPDLGTAMVTVSAAGGLLLVSGLAWRQMAALFILALAAASFVVGTGQLGDYQKDRLEVFFEPGRADADAQYNARQAKIAVAAGGITGQGWGQGEQTQLDWVPEQHTDFIFTAVAEELGFVGAGSLLLAYLVLSLRLVRVAHLSSDAFGTLLVAGILTMFVIQVFQNTGMSMGVMPITGIPLPLMSYGGSSTLAWFVMLGVAQAVHVRRNA